MFVPRSPCVGDRDLATGIWRPGRSDREGATGKGRPGRGDREGATENWRPEGEDPGVADAGRAFGRWLREVGDDDDLLDGHSSRCGTAASRRSAQHSDGGSYPRSQRPSDHAGAAPCEACCAASARLVRSRLQGDPGRGGRRWTAGAAPGRSTSPAGAAGADPSCSCSAAVAAVEWQFATDRFGKASGWTASDFRRA
jgi:hypothetical protein